MVLYNTTNILKNHWILYFKWMSCTIWELCLNKGVTKNSAGKSCIPFKYVRHKTGYKLLTHTGLLQLYKLNTNCITNKFKAKMFMSEEILLFNWNYIPSHNRNMWWVPDASSLEFSTHKIGWQYSDNQHSTGANKSEDTGTNQKTQQSHKPRATQSHPGECGRIAALPAVLRSMCRLHFSATSFCSHHCKILIPTRCGTVTFPSHNEWEFIIDILWTFSSGHDNYRTIWCQHKETNTTVDSKTVGSTQA